MRRDLASGEAIGPYRILEPLSEDALGRGYVAEHPRLGARVAVKVLARRRARPRRSSGSSARRAPSTRSRHERIVEILDLGTLDDGSAFVVTEHLDGAPRSARVRISTRSARSPGRHVTQIAPVVEPWDTLDADYPR